MKLPLYAEAEAIVSTLRGSTTYRAGELADKVGAWLRASEGRARAGQATARRREQEARAKILRAAGALPPLLPEHWSWSAAVTRRITRNPLAYGFPDGPPCPETIRKAHQYILTQAATVPSSTHTGRGAAYSVSSST